MTPDPIDKTRKKLLLGHIHDLIKDLYRAADVEERREIHTQIFDLAKTGMSIRGFGTDAETDARLLYHAVYALWHLDRKEEAMAAVTDGLKLFKGSPLLEMTRVSFKMESGDFAGVEDLLMSIAAKANPDSLRAQHLLIELACRQGDLAGALERYRALPENSDKPHALYYRILDLAYEKDSPELLELCGNTVGWVKTKERSLKDNPPDRERIEHLIKEYATRYCFDTKNKKQVDLLGKAAFLFFQERKYAEADTLYSRIGDERLSSYTMFMNVGYIAETKEDYARAEAFYRKAMPLQHNDEATQRLGFVLAMQERYEDAAAILSPRDLLKVAEQLFAAQYPEKAAKLGEERMKSPDFGQRNDLILVHSMIEAFKDKPEAQPDLDRWSLRRNETIDRKFDEAVDNKQWQNAVVRGWRVPARITNQSHHFLKQKDIDSAIALTDAWFQSKYFEDRHEGAASLFLALKKVILESFPEHTDRLAALEDRLAAVVPTFYRPSEFSPRGQPFSPPGSDADRIAQALRKMGDAPEGGHAAKLTPRSSGYVSGGGDDDGKGGDGPKGGFGR